MKLTDDQVERLSYDLHHRGDRARLLEELVVVLDEAIDGMPDHPWIPGVNIRPVVAKLAEIKAAS